MKLEFLPTLLITATGWWSSLWLTPDQLGQRLADRGEYARAAEAFRDPMRSGVAWYRAGEFKKAEQAFNQLATPEAIFNRGDCLVFQGKYEEAVACFEQALELRPGWEAAQANRKLARARAKLVESQGGDYGDQRVGADKVVFDKGAKSKGVETQTEADNGPPDAATQALWLRRVTTKPADFLRAKFAYQQAVGGSDQ
ncbi:Tetratricopeptide repeat protein [Planctomycetes bacterium MalM25]|nr:Tetratricopeptide repeat protein [Planctomycetes bacterium MalM25]